MGQLEIIKRTDYYSGVRRKKVISVTLFLSIVIHAFALIIFHVSYPVVGKKNLKIYRVNLIRPSIKDIKKSIKQKSPDLNQVNLSPSPEIRETTISLETENRAYYPYTTVIKHKIFEQWVYPLSAQKNKIQGNLLLSFRIDSDGKLIHCKTVRSSGQKILDLKAIEAIKMASPFPPFPDYIELDFININASFSYQLTFE